MVSLSRETETGATVLCHALERDLSGLDTVSAKSAGRCPRQRQKQKQRQNGKEEEEREKKRV
jgi:hypothetical protein